MLTKLKEKYIGGAFRGTPADETIENAHKYYDLAVVDEATGFHYWQDINYADRTMGSWDAFHHMGRIADIVTTFGRDRLLNDAEYLKKIYSLLDYWFYHDFIASNWWHNEIAMVMTTTDLLFKMDGIIDEERRKKAMEIVKRGTFIFNKGALRWTGANLMWGVMNTIKYGVLTDDISAINMAIDRASNAVYIAQPCREGIQPDYSFFQHGPRLYSGGYGCVLLGEISQLENQLQGTGVGLSEEKRNIIANMILEGLRYMTHCGTYDYACTGRNFSRAPIDASTYFLKTFENIPGFPRRDEIKAYRESIENRTPFEGTKYFEQSHMLCHHTKGMYFGVKFESRTICGTEHCNEEAILSKNLAYGTNYVIMRTGHEYRAISPVWDFAKVPGTTAYYEEEDALYENNPGAIQWVKCLQSAHSGGKQDGDLVAMYQQAVHEDMSLYVADFAIPGGLICLGTGLRCDLRREVNTTVEQCPIVGEIKREDGSLIHNEIRYTPLDGRDFTVETPHVIGSWKRNNRLLSDDPVPQDMLLITIPHTKETDGTYAYMITTAAEAAPKVTVLENTEDMQAVEVEGVGVMAVFNYDCTRTLCGEEISGKQGDVYIKKY
ncbi:MAG: hypothetical protein IKV39_01795 [Clostridia bacterium]|nr:hypothetical protein [Clostridia bacterium]